MYPNGSILIPFRFEDEYRLGRMGLCSFLDSGSYVDTLLSMATDFSNSSEHDRKHQLEDRASMSETSLPPLPINL